MTNWGQSGRWRKRFREVQEASGARRAPLGKTELPFGRVFDAVVFILFTERLELLIRHIRNRKRYREISVGNHHHHSHSVTRGAAGGRDGVHWWA